MIDRLLGAPTMLAQDQQQYYANQLQNSKIVNQQSLQNVSLVQMQYELQQDFARWEYIYRAPGPTVEELKQHSQLKDCWDQYNVMRALCGLQVVK